MTAGSWGSQRIGLAAGAILLAAMTAAAGAAIGGTADHRLGALAYLGIAVAALVWPTWIAAQVIGGQIIAGVLLIGQAAVAPLFMVPFVAAVIATAQLLAAVARLDSPLAAGGHGEVRRAALATAVGGGVYGSVALVTTVPGLTGLPAIGLAAGACVGLAILLASGARTSR